MSFFIRLIRNMLGAVIFLIDIVSRPRKLKRSKEAQHKVNQEASSLALYQFALCPFCIKTRRAIHKLNLPIVKRSVSKNSPFRKELEEQAGRVKAPCLRVKSGGKVEWLYESSDIIKYLEQRFNKN